MAGWFPVLSDCVVLCAYVVWSNAMRHGKVCFVWNLVRIVRGFYRCHSDSSKVACRDSTLSNQLCLFN